MTYEPLLFYTNNNAWPPASAGTRNNYGAAPLHDFKYSSNPLPKLARLAGRAVISDSISTYERGPAYTHVDGLQTAYADGHARWVPLKVIDEDYAMLPYDGSGFSQAYSDEITRIWQAMDDQ